MAKKYNYVFYLALLVAFGATFGVYRILEATRRANQVVTRPVVVANRDINQGELLDDNAFRVEHWPEPLVPDSAFGDPTLIAGRVSGIPVFAGEVFVPGRLAPEGTAPGLEAKIPLGKRAVSMAVDDITGIAGHIQPGAKVDLLLTLDVGGTAQRQSRLFMPNMKILAMGEQVTRNERGEVIKTHVATMEVTPAEGERLTMAMQQGRIGLMLRGYTDNDTVKTKGATSADVAALLRDVVPLPPRRPAPQQKAPVVEAPAPTPAPIATVQKPETLTIPVFRGRNKSEEKFKLDSVKRDSVRRDTIRP
jgi:pilus assembly protein CpaB